MIMTAIINFINYNTKYWKSQKHTSTLKLEHFQNTHAMSILLPFSASFTINILNELVRSRRYVIFTPPPVRRVFAIAHDQSTNTKYDKSCVCVAGILLDVWRTVFVHRWRRVKKKGWTFFAWKFIRLRSVREKKVMKKKSFRHAWAAPCCDMFLIEFFSVLNSYL